VLGLSAAFTIDSHWSVRARVENLTAKEYETLIGFPGEDRGLRVGLRYRRR
jgi:outer membrane cobalamin receptor